MTHIISAGYYLPRTVVTTEQLLSEIGPDRYSVEPHFIANNVGIERVRHAMEQPSVMAVNAAEQALSKSGVNPDDIDLIIYTGIEGDYCEPATAHIIQAKLGLKSKICFDVSNACLGFMSGMKIASDMIESGSTKYALVCTGERPSNVAKSVVEMLKKTHNQKFLQDRIGMLTVGDAGGAVLLGAHEGAHPIHDFYTESQGEHANLCYYKWENNQIDGKMIMGKICSLTISLHKGVYRKTLKQLGWEQTKIDCLITHQVGRRPFEILSHTFAVATEKMTRTYNWLGNLTSATFPVNLGIALESGQLKSGDNVYAALSGSGITVCHMGFTV